MRPQAEQLPDGTVYRYLGGHRVWHSPEAFPRSYVTDDHPLERYELFGDGILLVQRQEPWTQIAKSVELRFKAGSIAVTSSLTNDGAWPIEMAVWSLFLGSANGRLILPVVQRNAGLLPNTHYACWSYARMDDPRVHWGQRYVVLDHDEANDAAFKLGYANESGWMAYINNGCCLVKTFRHERGARYPDAGCSSEAYTAGWGIDIESLSPLQSGGAGGDDLARRGVVCVRLSAGVRRPTKRRSRACWRRSRDGPGSSCRSQAATGGIPLRDNRIRVTKVHGQFTARFRQCVR